MKYRIVFSDGTGDLTNRNFTVNHLQLANFWLNSILPGNAVNQFTFGFQYWNNLPSASFGYRRG